MYTKNIKTHENLKDSYYIESTLIQHYDYFSRIAKYEGCSKLSKLFKEIGEGGVSNAQGSFDFLMDIDDPRTKMPIGTTQLNLESLIALETKQFTEIYPQLIKEAREDGIFDVASWFETLLKLKRKHVELLKEASLQLSEKRQTNS